ncbi:MAG: hypothetical protein H3C43_03315 [Leptonema sp. (in: Bacteria)]|nr:hypothetical protein [Leptonema sp. (in: bacteria)]
MAKKAKKSTDSKETTSAAKAKKSNKPEPVTEDLSADSIDIDVYDEQPSGPTISIRTAKD